MPMGKASNASMSPPQQSSKYSSWSSQYSIAEKCPTYWSPSRAYANPVLAFDLFGMLACRRHDLIDWAARVNPFDSRRTRVLSITSFSSRSEPDSASHFVNNWKFLFAVGGHWDTLFYQHNSIASFLRMQRHIFWAKLLAPFKTISFSVTVVLKRIQKDN